jgi:hypothetical protein
LHDWGCTVEQCPYCGGQLISCDCDEQADRGGRVLDGHRLPWSGEWPGAAECREFGWFARAEKGRGWVPCQRGEPGAIEDLNRLLATAVWDPRKKRFVRR